MSDRLKAFDEQAAKVTQQRGAVYGTIAGDFGRASRLKAVVAECPDPLVRHTLEMICVKISRLIQSPDHLDSWIDIAGYARCGVMASEAAHKEPDVAHTAPELRIDSLESKCVPPSAMPVA